MSSSAASDSTKTDIILQFIVSSLPLQARTVAHTRYFVPTWSQHKHKRVKRCLIETTCLSRCQQRTTCFLMILPQQLLFPAVIAMVMCRQMVLTENWKRTSSEIQLWLGIGLALLSRFLGILHVTIWKQQAMWSLWFSLPLMHPLSVLKSFYFHSFVGLKVAFLKLAQYNSCSTIITF